MRERVCIGEKIFTWCMFFVIALPDNDIELIHIFPVPVSAYDAIFYYNDNTVEEFRYMDFVNKYLSSEWAVKHIPGYKPGMKIMLADAFCDIIVGKIFDAKKANERLYNKLSSMTRREYYNSKW